MTRIPDVSSDAGPAGLESDNYEKTRALVGYVSRRQATLETYRKLGFKCGLEIHQQLKTAKKLFCHCPAGVYQPNGAFNAEVIRHMRPTLSEMGEYDGTALMEKKTRKMIVYRIANETACTYDFDDTPPFKIDRQALDIALEIALLLKTNIVGELHITRKQYLDGSIPTGFQRTAIVGVEGEIPLSRKKVRIMQLSIEEDACREVSDVGHVRVYTTDRLGMPLIETVTYPDMLTPDEAAEAGQYLRMLVRTTGKVRTGIGAAREDVNVSVEGGTRVEIKGIAHIKWIPELTHNEAFRQRALLLIRERLLERIGDIGKWAMQSRELALGDLAMPPRVIEKAISQGCRLMAVNLPGFRDILSFFTQPGQTFADEISGRLKVIACIEKPHLIHSEQPIWSDVTGGDRLPAMLGVSDNDAQIIFWGPPDDIATALDTIDERCRFAFRGVPNETRKGLTDGTTIFERVLPGPDRMYPDTDSAPISITDQMVTSARERLPVNLSEWAARLREWKVPEHTFYYLVTRRLLPLVQATVEKTGWPPRFVTLLYGDTLKGAERRCAGSERPPHEQVDEWCRYVHEAGRHRSIARELLSEIWRHPRKSFDEILPRAGEPLDTAALQREIVSLNRRFSERRRPRRPHARTRWVMGQLKSTAAGRIDPAELAAMIEKERDNGRLA